MVQHVRPADRDLSTDTTGRIVAGYQPAAARAFRATFAFLEEAIESGRTGASRDGGVELKPGELAEEQRMPATHQKSAQGLSTEQIGNFSIPRANAEMPEYRIIDDKIWLGGVVANKKQAKKLLDFITAVTPLLRDAPEPEDDTQTESGGGKEKEKSVFKSEKEAYDFCRRMYKESGGVAPELRRAYEFYNKNYDDGCDPTIQLLRSKD